jgi:hypothetical protein
MIAAQPSRRQLLAGLTVARAEMSEPMRIGCVIARSG